MDGWRSYEGIDATTFMAAPLAPAAQSHVGLRSPANPAGSTILSTLASTAASLGRVWTSTVSSPPATTAATSMTTAPAGNPFGANFFSSPAAQHQQTGNPFAFNSAARTSNVFSGTPSGSQGAGNPFGAAPKHTPVEDANETLDAALEASPEEKRSWEAVDLTND